MYDVKNIIAAVNDYIETISHSNDLSKATVKAYMLDLNVFVLWLNKKEVPFIDNGVMREYINYLKDELHLKNSSIRRKVASFKVFFLKYFDDDIICKKINVEKENDLPKTISIENISKIFKIIESEIINFDSDFHKSFCVRDYAILKLIFCLGIRVGEITNLLINDIDFTSSTVFIRGTGLRERYLQIPSEYILSSLKEWLKLRNILKPISNYLFISKRGKQLTIDTLEFSFKRYLKMAELDINFTINMLRHTYAVCLFENGADFKDVQKLLGHEDIESVNVYAEMSLKKSHKESFDISSLLGN